jgi:hypothetical protein
MHDDDLLTIAEAAALLRCPIATLRYWRHLDVGPRSFKIRRRVMYRRGDVLAWLTAQVADGRGDAAFVPRGRQ